MHHQAKILTICRFVNVSKEREMGKGYIKRLLKRISNSSAYLIIWWFHFLVVLVTEGNASLDLFSADGGSKNSSFAGSSMKAFSSALSLSTWSKITNIHVKWISTRMNIDKQKINLKTLQQKNDMYTYHYTRAIVFFSNRLLSGLS